MRVCEIYKKEKTPISFEIFPPKGDLGVDTLRNVLDGLKDLNPEFISVTYSAGGTGDSNKTVELAGIIENEYHLNSVAHLTCINSNLNEIQKVISDIKEKNIENVLALRGDRIQGKTASDFTYSKDLIQYLKKEDFCIGAACYPEGHIECNSLEEDIDHLKGKQDAGADFFLSQLFFDNEYFYKFLSKVRSKGIIKPIQAGIMPILSKAQVSRMIFMCGASLPSAIIKILNRYENSPEDLRKAGIEYGVKQVLNLIENGVDGIHIYTMNQPDIAKSFVRRVEEKYD